MNHLVVNALKKALEEQPNHGICGALQTLYAKMPTTFTFSQQYRNFRRMLNCCETLDLCSKRSTFPIQISDKDPSMMYRDAKRKGTLWSKHSKYGRARRAVAELMIKELEDADNAVNNNSSATRTIS